MWLPLDSLQELLVLLDLSRIEHNTPDVAPPGPAEEQDPLTDLLAMLFPRHARIPLGIPFLLTAGTHCWLTVILSSPRLLGPCCPEDVEEAKKKNKL